MLQSTKSYSEEQVFLTKLFTISKAEKVQLQSKLGVTITVVVTNSWL